MRRRAADNASTTSRRGREADDGEAELRPVASTLGRCGFRRRARSPRRPWRQLKSATDAYVTVGSDLGSMLRPTRQGWVAFAAGAGRHPVRASNDGQHRAQLHQDGGQRPEETGAQREPASRPQMRTIGRIHRGTRWSDAHPASLASRAGAEGFGYSEVFPTHGHRRRIVDPAAD